MSMSDLRQRPLLRAEDLNGNGFEHQSSENEGTPTPLNSPTEKTFPKQARLGSPDIKEDLLDGLHNEILRNKAQVLKGKFEEQLEHLQDLTTHFDDLIRLVEDEHHPLHSSLRTARSPTQLGALRKGPQNGKLVNKRFYSRPSLLTELFEIPHIQTIHYIFIAVLLVFIISTIINDLMYHGTIGVDFQVFKYTFGKFPAVMAVWGCMQASTLVIVYPILCFWAKIRRRSEKADGLDFGLLAVYAVYQLLFLVVPVFFINHLDLPPSSTAIVVAEQIRFMMKSHAFVREKIPTVLKSSIREDSTDSAPILDFSKYLYFQFVPTLVYRDNYPRTKKIRWNFVLTNLANVVGAIMYAYYIFIRFCIPVFQNFNHVHVNFPTFVSAMFSCILPGALLFVVVFFALLHCWMNAFAEMLRFADRMFYRDWWNSTNFSNYYRTWNVVVHDWLYTYMYKDLYLWWGEKNRHAAMMATFTISALFHEYIFCCMFRFFYPVLFVLFGGMGVWLLFVTQRRSSPPWNVLLWTLLMLGLGVIMCLYTVEYYARLNCPPSTDNLLLDYMIPRSWTCYLVDAVVDSSAPAAVSRA